MAAATALGVLELVFGAAVVGADGAGALDFVSAAAGAEVLGFVSLTAAGTDVFGFDSAMAVETEVLGFVSPTTADTDVLDPVPADEAFANDTGIDNKIGPHNNVIPKTLNLFFTKIPFSFFYLKV